MHDEDGFLNTLLENPADDTTRLVYADWLDEQADPLSAAKARFLRLTARMSRPDRPESDDAELQQFAAKLDTDWLAVVSRLRVEGCGLRRPIPLEPDYVRGLFTLLCDRGWDEMTPTGEPGVRHCDKCREDVHYCDTIVTARRHARQGHCVAVDLGILRRPNDLAPPAGRILRGRISYQRLQELRREERGRTRVDAVSRAREAAKRKKRDAD